MTQGHPPGSPSYKLYLLGLLACFAALFLFFRPLQLRAAWVNLGFYPPPTTFYWIKVGVLCCQLLGVISFVCFLLQKKMIPLFQKGSAILLLVLLSLSFFYHGLLSWGDHIITTPRIELVSPTGNHKIYIERWTFGFAGVTTVYAHTSKSGSSMTERILELPSTSDSHVVRLNWAPDGDSFGIFYREHVPSVREILTCGYDFSRNMKIVEGTKSKYHPTPYDSTASLSGHYWQKLKEDVTASEAVIVDLEKLLKR